MISLIYVSQALLDPRDRVSVLEDIQATAIARNTMLNVTGLLIASPDHYAELIEGPTLSVIAVMSSTRDDPRHTALRVVRQSSIEKAGYPHWRMARFAENFSATIIAPLLGAAHAGDDPKAVRRLERLIGSFAA